ncbi:MAG: insulinase family protein [Oscillospiraceae bacterium]|nr:insulinase family protein [Oscillospiraceae bacterium]
MDNVKTYQICEGVNFNSIRETRFKTGRISITMFLPLANETASQSAILPFLLTRSCGKYPDFTSLNKQLNDLYGASLDADTDRVGEAQTLSISASFLDDRYALYGETISAEVTDLLCEVLFYPRLIDGVFAEDDLEQEKRQLAELIDSEYSDKKLYAKLRCEQVMCKDEKYSINPLGEKKEVLALSPQKVKEAWERALKLARIEIIALGDLDPEPILACLKKAFSLIEREKPCDCSTEIIKIAEKAKEVTEYQDIAQTKLVLGFRSSIAGVDKNFFSSRVMASLFGGTPHSKLFLNVREKLSLCYYCSAFYERQKGIMFVQSGVEKQNIVKAKHEILNQLEQIKKGNFTDEEISATKLNISNNYISINDSLASLDTFYTSQSFDSKKYSPSEYAAEIEKITREQIIAAANATSLDTVYYLTSK